MSQLSPPFSSLLDLEFKSFFTPLHFTLLSNRRVSSASCPSLTVAIASSGTERRKAAFQKSSVLWRAEIHSGAGTSHILTRLIPVLTTLAWFKEVTGLGDTELERLRWNHQLCCEFCTCPCTWAMSKGLWKSHLQSSCKHNPPKHPYLLPFCRLLTHCMFTRICSSYAQSSTKRFDLWKVGHAAKAISEVVSVKH